MSKEECGCENSTESANISTQKVQPQQTEHCLRSFHQPVTAVAEIVVTPSTSVAATHSRCIGDPVILTGEFPDVDDEYRFVVAQPICTEADIRFGADIAVTRSGLIYGDPSIGPCVTPPGDTCTHSANYYKRHSAITNQLIGDAGGEIILGPANKSGLTITVTTENAHAILNLDPPSPAPEDPPFNEEYAHLYAQLLAAHLNMLRGAKCDYVTVAIIAANTFIGNSPTGGMLGAHFVHEALSFFNKGLAPNCPTHCSKSLNPS